MCDEQRSAGDSPEENESCNIIVSREKETHICAKERKKLIYDICAKERKKLIYVRRATWCEAQCGERMVYAVRRSRVRRCVRCTRQGATRQVRTIVTRLISSPGLNQKLQQGIRGWTKVFKLSKHMYLPLSRSLGTLAS